MGGSARRLDPRPRRQDAAQEEDHVEEEEGVRPSEDGRKDVQEEEEVAAAESGPASSVPLGRPGLAVSLPDAVDSRPLVGLVVNWEETEPELDQ